MKWMGTIAFESSSYEIAAWLLVCMTITYCRATCYGMRLYANNPEQVKYGVLSRCATLVRQMI